MSEHLLVGLTLILVLGIAARWIAWRLHLPSILLLLLSAITIGPVTGFLNPDNVFGELLLPLVSISVAVILFEGGLSLSLADLREIGSIVRNLVTLGVLVTWVITTGAAHFILGFGFPLALLLGAILVVLYFGDGRLRGRSRGRGVDGCSSEVLLDSGLSAQRLLADDGCERLYGFEHLGGERPCLASWR